MKEYNQEELNKIKSNIDGMKSICAEGRKEVLALVESIIGKPLARAEGLPSSGDVYGGRSGFKNVLILGHYTLSDRELSAVYLDQGPGLPIMCAPSSDNLYKLERQKMADRLRELGYKRVGRLADELMELGRLK